MYTHIALLLVGALPVSLLYFLPRNTAFFKKASIKGFGLGVYAALVFVLLKESFEHGGGTASISGLTIGLLVSLGIGYYFKEFHHHHDESHTSHVHTKISTIKILISDFLHNIIDGIAIVSGFAINNTVGLMSLVGVLGHQVIQQSGQQILLASEGVKPLRALGLSFLISLSVFFALFWGENETLESIIMTVSAGIIFFKIIIDIKETKWRLLNIVTFVLGFVLLLGSLLLIPHIH